ncbi:MAG: Gx transporter family protein [Lachnospiraceae bacterium]|nr:Gx transporter family protein [Lachnospiraceae bacterium]
MKNKVAYFGIFTSLAMILGYIESLFPFFWGIPGVKLGLANSMSLTILYFLGAPAAFLISGIRIILTGFLFGNAFSVIYSFAGALLSMSVMVVLKKTNVFSIVGISMAGGIFHNIGQLIAAIFLVENLNLLYYLPVLLLSGAVTGLVIGLLSREILKRIPDSLLEESVRAGRSFHFGADAVRRKKK